MKGELTKDAQKVVAVIYRAFLEKRRSGASRDESKRVRISEVEKGLSSDMQPGDVRDCILEIRQAFRCKSTVTGIFIISDDLISYMENRFKNGLMDIASFLSQFIP